MRNTRYNAIRAQLITAGKEIRRRYLHASHKPTVTIPVTNGNGSTNVYYGLSRGHGFYPQGQMKVLVTGGRALLIHTHEQHNGPAERIVHGDVLAIGDDLYQVHCPDGYRMPTPALHRVA